MKTKIIERIVDVESLAEFLINVDNNLLRSEFEWPEDKFAKYLETKRGMIEFCVQPDNMPGIVEAYSALPKEVMIRLQKPYSDKDLASQDLREQKLILTPGTEPQILSYIASSSRHLLKYFMADKRSQNKPVGP